MGTTEKPNFGAVVKFTLLGAKLEAGVERTSEGDHIFLYQDVTSPNDGVTIDKLISDVNALIGSDAALDEGSISNQLKPFGKDGAIDVSKIRFILSTVYLDIKTVSGERTVEYAFRIDVNAAGLINDKIDLINIDSLSLAVWNTTNDKIQKQLALTAAP